MVDIEVDLDNDTICELIDLYLKDTMSKESYSVFKDNNNGYMLAAADAVCNEAILKAIEAGIKHDNLPEA